MAAASGRLRAQGALDGLLGDVDGRLVVELGDVGGHPTLGLDQVVGREDGVGPRISAALGGPGVEHDRARLDTAQDVDDGGGFQARSDGVKGHETVEGLVPGPHRVVHGEARRAERPGDQHPPCLPLVELTARQVGEARFPQAIGEDLRVHGRLRVATEAQSLHGQAPDVRDPLGRLRGLHGAAGERCGVPVTGQLGAPAAVQLCPVSRHLLLTRRPAHGLDLLRGRPERLPLHLGERAAAGLRGGGHPLSPLVLGELVHHLVSA